MTLPEGLLEVNAPLTREEKLGAAKGQQALKLRKGRDRAPTTWAFSRGFADEIGERDWRKGEKV
jgi:hypothetical protein